jgi:hypothetical protein
LKLPNFAPLPLDLAAHTLDFGSELIKLHHVLAQLKLFQFAGAQPSSADLPFQKCGADAIA